MGFLFRTSGGRFNYFLQIGCYVIGVYKVPRAGLEAWLGVHITFETRKRSLCRSRCEYGGIYTRLWNVVWPGMEAGGSKGQGPKGPWV